MIQDAEKIFSSAVKSVLPETLVRETLSVKDETLCAGDIEIPLSKKSKLWVFGAGKAAAAMALVAEDILGDRLAGGTVIVKYGHTLPLKKITVFEAAHPVPDENGIKATQALIQNAKNIFADDVVIFMLSGGASALLVDVPEGLQLSEITFLQDTLLRSGASIYQLNAVRKQFSDIKAGGLINFFAPATIISLIISDVPDNDLSIIGSGPTVKENSSAEQCKQILSAFNLWDSLSQSMKRHLANKMEESSTERLHALSGETFNLLIGNNQTALKAASSKAIALGYDTYIHPVVLEGDSNDSAKEILSIVLNKPVATKSCFLFGSETTVRVNGQGKGGRCQQMVLSAFKQLKNEGLDIVFFAAGTDGQDGPTDAAGAFINKASFYTAAQMQIDENQYLQNTDSYHFFEQIKGLVKTGPTYTNVMDVVIVLIQHIN